MSQWRIQWLSPRKDCIGKERLREAFEMNRVADVYKENRRKRSTGGAFDGSLRKFEIENGSCSDTACEACVRVIMKMFMKQIHIDCLFPETREC